MGRCLSNDATYSIKHKNTLFQTLFTYPGNFRAEKILSVAKMSDSSVKVDDKFVFGETNKSEAFLKKFPLGKVCCPCITVNMT